MLSYEGKNGTMHYFNVICGNGDTVPYMRCYQRTKFSMIIEGLTYKFSNMIKKGDVNWVISTSLISIVPPVQCSADCPLLPEDEPVVGQKRSIEQALSSPQKSTVCAKIAKVSPMVLKSEGTLPFRCIGIKDSTGVVKVALFEKMARQEYVPESVIELSGVYKKNYKGAVQLVASDVSECQFLANDKVAVDITPADAAMFGTDPDFGGEAEPRLKVEELLIISLVEAFIYDACDYEGCYMKKMKDNICPTCSGTSSKKTCRGKVEVQKEDGSTMTTTLFAKDLSMLFGLIDLGLYGEGIDMLVGLSYMLPVKFQGHVKGNQIYNIKKN